MAKATVSIELEGSPMQIAAQKKQIELLMQQSSEKRSKVNHLLSLREDHQNRIFQITGNEAALEGLENNWSMLEGMFN